MLDHKVQIKKHKKLKLRIISNLRKEVASDEESIGCECQMSSATCQDKLFLKKLPIFNKDLLTENVAAS